MKTFYINPATGDYELDGQNRFKMIDGDDAIRQGIWIILTTNLGEWFLNTAIGFDRFEVLGQKFNEDNAINELYAAILQHEAIGSVENVTVDFDGPKRKLTIKYVAIKKDGEIIEGAATV